jgi:hypothetical protein
MSNATKYAFALALIPTSFVWIVESMTVGYPSVGTGLCFVGCLAVHAHLRINRLWAYNRKYGGK